MKVLVIFRNDDVCAWSDPEHEARLLRLFNDYRVPVTLGVVPRVRGWRLEDNRAILRLLEQALADGHELALHGWEHDQHEFERLPLAERQRRLKDGQEWFLKQLGLPARTFIPPDNAWTTELLPLLAENGFTAVSAGVPLLSLPLNHQTTDLPNCRIAELPNHPFIVDAIARFLHTPLIALIAHLAELSFSQPVPLVVYFHSWELARPTHWLWMERILQAVRDTKGVVPLTFAEAARRFPETLQWWAGWRTDDDLVARWNQAFTARPFYNAHLLHRYWREVRAHGLPVPALEQWMVAMFVAALTGDVAAMEALVAQRATEHMFRLPAVKVADGLGWVPLLAGAAVGHFKVKPPTRMEEAFRIAASPVLRSLMMSDNSTKREAQMVDKQTAATQNRSSRSIVYLSFDQRLVSEHAAMTTKALAKRGWRVVLVHPHGATLNATPDGVMRVEVGRRWQTQRQMTRLLTHWRPPVVYARQHWQGLLPLLAAKRLGIPYVAEFNGLRHRGELRRNPRSLKGWLIWWLERWCARTATAVVVPSRPLAHRIAQLIGKNTPIHDLTTSDHASLITPSRLTHHAIFVVPNGIDPDIFRPLPQAEVRRQLGLPEDGLLVAYTGSLHVWQGVDVLLHAFTALTAKFPNCRLLVVGGQDEPHKETYRQLAHDLRIADRVLFVPFVPYEQSALYIAAADVCVAPYVPIVCEVGGGSPLKLYAYLSCGRPVVLSDLGEFVDVDLVRRSGAGILVPPGDPNALADALATLLADPALREEMGRRGREAILNGYTWDHNAERIEAVLGSVMRDS